jgi:hypothetical protein
MGQGVVIDFPNYWETNIAIFAADGGPIFHAKTIIGRDSVVMYSSARAGVDFHGNQERQDYKWEDDWRDQKELLARVTQR